jgi:hypothetical protein
MKARPSAMNLALRREDSRERTSASENPRREQMNLRLRRILGGGWKSWLEPEAERERRWALSGEGLLNSMEGVGGQD